jgi:hypothetical protein
LKACLTISKMVLPQFLKAVIKPESVNCRSLLPEAALPFINRA